MQLQHPAATDVDNSEDIINICNNGEPCSAAERPPGQRSEDQDATCREDEHMSEDSDAISNSNVRVRYITRTRRKRGAT